MMEAIEDQEFLAHVSETKDRIHALEDHLRAVAELAAAFAAHFGHGDWARPARRMGRARRNPSFLSRGYAMGFTPFYPSYELRAGIYIEPTLSAEPLKQTIAPMD